MFFNLDQRVLLAGIRAGRVRGCVHLVQREQDPMQQAVTVPTHAFLGRHLSLGRIVLPELQYPDLLLARELVVGASFGPAKTLAGSSKMSSNLVR